MKIKIILAIIMGTILAGCTAPTLKTKNYSEIDMFEKNIQIDIDDKDMELSMQMKFNREGWRVVYKEDKEAPRYNLRCKSQEKEDRYNVQCILKDTNTNYIVSEAKTILYRNGLGCTAKLVYEGITNYNSIRKVDLFCKSGQL